MATKKQEINKTVCWLNIIVGAVVLFAGLLLSIFTWMTIIGLIIGIVMIIGGARSVQKGHNQLMGIEK
jgi:hypothetical protein